MIMETKYLTIYLMTGVKRGDLADRLRMLARVQEDIRALG